MNYEYPYTDFHEMNLDYILKLARESLGLNLVVEGNKLLLKNNLGETISNVTIHYADTSLNDVDGKPIKSYILSAGTENNSVIFTKGDGTTTMITVPYATKATNDDTGRNITRYIVNVNPSEKRLNFTRGDGTTLSFEVPFAQTALGDKNSKDITTYVASISTNGDELVITDGNGIVLSQFKVTYAEKAKNDVDGDAIKSYAKVLQTGERTVKLLSKEGNVLSEITVPFATMAMEDTSGRSLLEDYGATLDVINNDIALKSFSGKTLSTITVPFATVSTDATNAIERVEVSGNNIAFTTFGGTRYEITSPYSLKAASDASGNTITKNYVAAVEKDSTTGDFVFKAKDGTEIARLVSESETAKNDTFGNLIANYIKTIVVSDTSNYVTVTHGDGTVDTLTINYAQQAWKDTYGNIIGNFYIGFLKCINDEKTGDPVVVAYNGENAELFRFSVKANSAKYDDNGNNIYTSYASSLTYSDNTLKLLAKSGDELSSVTIDIPEPITGYGKSLSLAGQTLTLKDENSADLSSVELPTTDLSSIEDDITSLEYGQNLLDERVETLENTPPYTLPIASADTLGGIKVGNNLTIDSDGVLNAPTPTPAITNYGKSLSISNKTLSLKDETDTVLNSVDLPIPNPYTLPVASASRLGGIKKGTSLRITNTGVLDTDDFVIALDYNASTKKYSINSTKSSSKTVNINTTIHIQVYKDDVLCFTTYGNLISANGQKYVVANLNLSEIDSPGSSTHSNIYGTIIMQVSSSSISILNSYVCYNTIAFNTFGNASDLTNVIKLYKGFTSSSDLTPLFRYNYFSINPSNASGTYHVVKPIEIVSSGNEVVFYYINNSVGKEYLKCDSYDVKKETYTNYWSKQITLTE